MFGKKKKAQKMQKISLYIYTPERSEENTNTSKLPYRNASREK